MSDRSYQENVYGEVLKKFSEGKRRILLVGPTGCGKGYMSGRFMQKVVEKGNDCVFFADQRELIFQIDKQMERLGIPTNIVMRGVKQEYQSYEDDVASRQCNLVAKDTLHARAFRSEKMKRPSGKLVLVDEAHKSISRTWMQILRCYGDSLVLGWTATPCRSDGRPLGSFYDSMIQVATYKELQEQGFLVPVRVYAPDRPDLVGLGRSMGDYSKKDLEERMNKDKLVGNIVKEWKRHANGRQTVVFASGVNHSIHLRDEFRKIGVTAEHIDGSMDQRDRDEIMQEARDGKVQVLCNYGVLHTGVDIPNLKVLVCARPTKSFSLWRQMAGRIQRPAAGHTECLILDHSMNTLNFGYPDEDVDWDLGDDTPIHIKHKAKQAGEGKQPKQCPKCKQVITSRRCQCGYEFPERKGKEVKGKTEKLKALDRRKVGNDDKQKVWNECLGWCIGNDRKLGAAAHRYKDRFGVWPNSSLVNVPRGKREWNMSGKDFYNKVMKDGQ